MMNTILMLDSLFWVPLNDKYPEQLLLFVVGIDTSIMVCAYIRCLAYHSFQL